MYGGQGGSRLGGKLPTTERPWLDLSERQQKRPRATSFYGLQAQVGSIVPENMRLMHFKAKEIATKLLPGLTVSSCCRSTLANLSEGFKASFSSTPVILVLGKGKRVENSSKSASFATTGLPPTT